MKTILISLLIFLSIAGWSQNDSVIIDKKHQNRYGVWLIPSASENIYGFAIGLVGSEAICNRPYTKHSHGINLQLPGQGFFQTFYINKVHFKDFTANDTTIEFFSLNDTTPMRALHNGLLVSLFGTFTDQINGVSLSSWMSMGRKVNGLSINLFWNLYDKINGAEIALVNHAGTVKGVQIGLVNKTVNLQGVQIGLWNKNIKRALPIINWQFKK